MGVKVREKDGLWFVFLNHQKQRKAKCCGAGELGRKSAEALAIRMRADLQDPSRVTAVFAPAASTIPTLTAYAETWMKTHALLVCKASTRRSYEDLLNLHILPALGNKALSSISRVDCRALIATCREKGLAPKSLSNIARGLSTVLSGAVEDGIIGANPAFRLGKYCRGGDALPFQVQPFTKDECSLFLNAARAHTPRYYPLFLTALSTGMRLGELLGLQWGDIDFHGRFIHVQRNRVLGVTTTPKSHKTRRIDIGPQLVKELTRLLAERKVEKLRRGWAELPAWIFVNETGAPLDSENLRHRVFYRVLEKAGLRHVRFHDLRHTYASLLLRAGEPITYVRDQLGHSSIKMTVDIYGHLVPGGNRAAADRLEMQIGATAAQPDIDEAVGEVTYVAANLELASGARAATRRSAAVADGENSGQFEGDPTNSRVSPQRPRD